jgi:GH15 family glucan-1,4-alpha-glucosidase
VRRHTRTAERYPPIDDYAFIADCHAAALVSSRGSVDWCCMPRFDSASVFGRLLDWDSGGYCEVAPAGEFTATRAYVDGTLVLTTTYRTDRGEADVIDCFTMREGGAQRGHQQLLRVVEGRSGTTDFAITVAPRYDYGEVEPWIRQHSPARFSAIGGNDALVVSCDVPLTIAGHHDLVASFEVRAGQRVRLSIVSVAPETIDPAPPAQADAAELDRRLDETVRWWQTWSDRLVITGPYAAGAKRSATVLKGLVHAPTGAVVAAPTTSLPEAIGAARNWDYRFTWIRDSHFAVRSLAELGAHAEADGFRRFVERSAAGSIEALQVLYGVGGERRLDELELQHLEGYRGSRPVRVGNSAARQTQFDIYGELVDLAWRWHQRGRSPDDDYWRFLESVVEHVAEHWREPDRGLWELRGEPRHFVFSKAMCWVALDRGIRLAHDSLRRAPRRHWEKERDELRRAIDEQGFDEQRNAFVQSFGSTELDAAMLLLPVFDVVAYDDPRMISTVDAIQRELDDDGLVRRYDGDDELEGREGSFLPCSFWLAECLARQGRVGDARKVYDRAMATANDIGLFSEEYDTEHHMALGNFPQTLTHLSHVSAAVALTAASETAPVGLLGPSEAAIEAG